MRITGQLAAAMSAPRFSVDFSTMIQSASGLGAQAPAASDNPRPAAWALGPSSIVFLTVRLPGEPGGSDAAPGRRLARTALAGVICALAVFAAGRVAERLLVGADEAAARARAVLDRLLSPPGSPNWFGEQRFGAAGNNAGAGRALLDGGGRGRRGPAPRERRLLVSAYQSELFNRYLRRRIEGGSYARVLSGDLLSLRRGGLFATTDPVTDQARLEAGELAPTGPMFGHKMRGPAAGSDAAALEQAILDEEGIAPADFRRLGKLAPGTRRPLAIAIEDVTVEALGDDAIRIGLALPSGAYATSVLREIMKSEPAAAERSDPDDASGEDPDDDPEPANTGAAGAETR